MPFRSFRDKRKPPRPMRFWRGSVSHHIDPEVLRPGDKARHKVVVNNVDLARHEYTVVATCQGKHLKYGTDGRWEPQKIISDRGTRLDPAAITEIELPKSVDEGALPAVEQIDISVSATVHVRNETAEKQRVYTLMLEPAE